MQTDSKNNYLLPVLMAGCIAVGLWLGNILSPGGIDFSDSGGAAKYQKIQDIIEVLDQKYVDSLNADDLFEQTISDMLHKLDPHSNYIPAKDLQLMKESIEGKFGGVGVRFFILRDTICITNIVAGSPSFRAGLKAGDKIIKVDGKKVAGTKITNERVMALLKGQENTTVQLHILRKKKILEKEVVRGTIPIESIVSAYMIEPTIGYIRIDQFSVNTSDEFRRAASWLKNMGMKKLVLDLRNNGGGVMESATDIADEFLGANVPIVKTKGAHMKTVTYSASRGGLLEKTPLTILINEHSASASEILAGAIQDNDRGTIIGRRSFGKGLVGQDFPLRDGSNLRLTVARYYTPTGRCIQNSYDEGYEEYVLSQMNRYDSGELYAPDTTLLNDSLKFKTPKGKIVYGGGGIMPDVFVPFDSAGMNMYYTELRYSQAFNAFAFDYVQNKRNNWTSVKDFDKSFQVTDKLIQKFARFAAKEYKIKIDANGLKHSSFLISRTLKAEIARQIWLEDGYYQILNKTDNEVKAALKSLQ